MNSLLLGYQNCPFSVVFFIFLIRLMTNSMKSSGYRVKWLERKAVDSPPFSTKVNNSGAIPPLLICLHDLMLN
jgi:hypothetical protein